MFIVSNSDRCELSEAALPALAVVGPIILG
jgi:hypothetical protein